MRSLDENIESLSRAVLSEASGEADRIVAEARSKAEAISQRAREQAEAERGEIIDRAQAEANRLRSQSVATAHMKARTMELERREVLLEKVFQGARAQLASIQQWSDYNQISLRLLREALSKIEAKEVVVRADARTQAFFTEQVLDDMAKKFNTRLKLGEPLVGLTGVTVETADGHLYYDNTLETRLNRLQNNLRSPVYHLLIGESL